MLQQIFESSSVHESVSDGKQRVSEGLYFLVPGIIVCAGTSAIRSGVAESLHALHRYFEVTFAIEGEQATLPGNIEDSGCEAEAELDRPLHLACHCTCLVGGGTRRGLELAAAIGIELDYPMRWSQFRVGEFELEFRIGLSRLSCSLSCCREGKKEVTKDYERPNRGFALHP